MKHSTQDRSVTPFGAKRKGSARLFGPAGPVLPAPLDIGTGTRPTPAWRTRQVPQELAVARAYLDYPAMPANAREGLNGA